jgi:hypothetical protein
VYSVASCSIFSAGSVKSFSNETSEDPSTSAPSAASLSKKSMTSMEPPIA